MAALAWAARHGRLILVAGLVLGIAWPGLARAMEPLIAPLIALLLLLAALRIGPEAALPPRRALPRTLGRTLLLQTVAPLVGLGLLALFGWETSIAGIGIVLVLAAAPITGSPGLAILSGADPEPALRQLVIGTALLPLTVLPIFALMPVFADPGAALGAVARLLGVIVLAVAGAWLLRRHLPFFRAPEAAVPLDGFTTLVMALVVVALMSAVGPALVERDPALWRLLALTLAVNFGLQVGVWTAMWRAGHRRLAAPMAIVAGNRNLALFLTALPPEIVEALLLFVGCFQVPMYLTPLVMAPLYRRGAVRGGGRG